jgi:hypothetical protein
MSHPCYTMEAQTERISPALYDCSATRMKRCLGVCVGEGEAVARGGERESATLHGAVPIKGSAFMLA